MKDRKGLYAILVIALSLLLVGSCGKVEEEESSPEKEEVARKKPQTKVEEGEPSPEKEEPAESSEARGKVLARVNGVPIREEDIMLLAGSDRGPGFPPMPYVNPPSDPEEYEQWMEEQEKEHEKWMEKEKKWKEKRRKAHIRSLLGETINQELLYQEAKRMGLDRDKDYLKILERRERQELRELEFLASFYERTILGRWEMPVPETIPEKEVEEYYQKHKSYYGKRGEEAARRDIRTVLANYKAFKIGEEWRKKILRKAKVKVNGESISSQVLLDSLRPSPAPMPPGSRRELPPAKASPLVDKVKEIAIKQEARRRKVSKRKIEKDKKLVEELCYQAIISFDKEELVVRKRSRGQSRGYALLHRLQTYLIAAVAKKKGVDKYPEYLVRKKRVGSRPLPGEPIRDRIEPRLGKKASLVSILRKKKGIDDLPKVKVSQAEIDERYEKRGRILIDDMIRRQLQWKKRKKRKKLLPGQKWRNLPKVKAEVVEVSQAEIDDLYEKNKTGYEKKARDMIRGGLQRRREDLQLRKAGQRWDDLVDSLRAKADIEIL